MISSNLARIERRLPELYIAIALLVGLSLCLLTPPFFGPDEAAHSKRALELGHGQLLSLQTPQGIGAPLDTGLIQAIDEMAAIEAASKSRYPIAHTRPDGRMTLAQQTAVERVVWTRRVAFSDFPNTSIYPPMFYLPEAIGWRLGELNGWSIVRSLQMARILTLLTAVAMGWLALWLCAAERWLLFGYLLLPGGLNVMASCTQDALLLAAAALAVAVVTRALVARRLMNRTELVTVAVLIGGCIGARPPYLPLELAFFLPGLNLCRVAWRDLRAPMMAAVLVLAGWGSWQVMAHPQTTMVAPGADPVAQVTYLRRHPLAGAVKIAVGTAHEAPGLVLKGIEVLAAGDVFPPAAIYGALLIALGAVLVSSPVTGLDSDWARWLLLLLLAGTVAGISIAEYVVWTPVGSSQVFGLQARYYLPLLPFGILLIPRRKGLSQSRLGGRILIGATSCLVLAVAYTPWLAARVFYRLDLTTAIQTATR